jgi:hypothetical protein
MPRPFKAPRKNKQREKYPAPGAGLIAADSPESRQSGLKTGQNGRIRAKNGEYSPFADR